MATAPWLGAAGAATGLGVAAYGLRNRKPALIVGGLVGSLASGAAAALASSTDEAPAPPPPPSKPKLNIGALRRLGSVLTRLNVRRETQVLSEADFVSLRASTAAVMRTTGKAAGTALAGVLLPVHPLELLGRSGTQDRLADDGMRVISPVWRLKSNGKAARWHPERGGFDSAANWHRICGRNDLVFGCETESHRCRPRDEGCINRGSPILRALNLSAPTKARGLALRLARVLMPEFSARHPNPTTWEEFGPDPTATGPSAGLVAPWPAYQSRADVQARNQAARSSVVLRDQSAGVEALQIASGSMPGPMLMHRYWMLRTFCEAAAPYLAFLFIPLECDARSKFDHAVQYFVDSVVDPFSSSLATELRIRRDPLAEQLTRLNQNVLLLLQDYWAENYYVPAAECPPPPKPGGLSGLTTLLAQVAPVVLGAMSGNPMPLIALTVSSLASYAPPEVAGALNIGLAAVGEARQFGTGGFQSLQQLGMEYSARAEAMVQGALDELGAAATDGAGFKVGTATVAFSGAGLSLQNGSLGLTVGPDGVTTTVRL